MKKSIFTLLGFFAAAINVFHLQDGEHLKDALLGSTVMRRAICYSRNQREWTERVYYRAIGCFLIWGQNEMVAPNTTMGSTDITDRELIMGKGIIKETKTNIGQYV